ncbi:hypothetical protein [Paenibacillus lactis]|uniref:hypothetical protein n=1 Tax=Paenibacillus lactis TaxID=228574 RepID=UPI0036C10D2C
MSRDWQLDMERCKDFTSMESKSVYIKALEYWLQQYKESEELREKLVRGTSKQLFEMERQYAAEKERADKAEQHNVELCKQILETEAREQKLKEALEKIKLLGWSVCFGGGYEYGGEHHAEALSIAGTVLASLYPKEGEE